MIVDNLTVGVIPPFRSLNPKEYMDQHIHSLWFWVLSIVHCTRRDQKAQIMCRGVTLLGCIEKCGRTLLTELS